MAHNIYLIERPMFLAYNLNSFTLKRLFNVGLAVIIAIYRYLMKTAFKPPLNGTFTKKLLDKIHTNLRPPLTRR